jgi:hypothetical protein
MHRYLTCIVVAFAGFSNPARADLWGDFVGRSLVVRMPSTAASTHEINSVGITVEVPVKKGDDLRGLLLKRCGDGGSDIESQTKRLNSTLVGGDWKSTADGVFKAPPCLRFFRDTTVPIDTNLTPAQEVARVTGSNSVQMQEEISKRNPQVADFYNKQPAGQSLTFGEIPAYTTLHLSAQASRNSSTTIARLTSLGGTVARANKLTLIRPVTVQDLSGNPSCSLQQNESWPFAVNDVLRSLVTLQRLGMTPDTPTRLLVIDTGVPNKPRGFPLNVFDTGSALSPVDKIAFPSVNLDDDPDREHGTLVSSLTLGGAHFLDVDLDTATRVRLRMVNVEKSAVIADPNGGGPINIVGIDEASVANALTLSTGYAPDIANVSLEGDARSVSIEDQIRNSPGLLVVVAAGNSGNDLAQNPHYPAALGGESGSFPAQVISVAAHDPDGNLLTSSNFSARYADIAAPGCAIPALGLDGASHLFAGTSVASPLVAFTSILLRAYGMSTPRQIKERILDSAEVTPALVGKVVSNGRLSIPKALALTDDIVEIAGENVFHLGTATLPDPFSICGETVPVSNIRKIYTLPDSTNPHSFNTTLAYVDAQNRRSVKTCGSPLTEIQFSENGSAATITYSLQSIRDFVPAVKKVTVN